MFDKWEVIEGFVDKIDLQLGGVDTCAKWLKLEEKDRVIIKKSLKILDRYREAMYNCNKMKEYKKILKVEEILEASRRNAL